METVSKVEPIFEYLNEKDIRWERKRSVDVSDDLMTEMYKLYEASYPYPRRFSDLNSFTKNVLENCTYLCYKNNTELIGYFLIVITNFGIKLTMSCVKQKPFTKQILYNKLAKLLVTPGYYQESSGPVSWILRSRYHLYPITDENKIKAVLKNKLIQEYGGIKMNPNWKFNLSAEQVYERYVRSRYLNKIEGKDVYFKSMKESLFVCHALWVRLCLINYLNHLLIMN